MTYTHTLSTHDICIYVLGCVCVCVCLEAWLFVSSCFFRAALGLSVVCLEGDLEDPVAKGIAIKGLDGHQSLLVVGHCDEPEALALVCLEIADDLEKGHVQSVDDCFALFATVLVVQIVADQLFTSLLPML